MAEKLKSITKRIPWFLLLKPALIAVSWYFAPLAVFVVVALGCYFIPFFRPRSVWTPAVITFGFSLVLPVSPWTALFIFTLTLILFGIKDLTVVGRGEAHELFTSLALFASILYFFFHTGNIEKPLTFFSASVPALVFFFLGKDVLVHGTQEILPVVFSRIKVLMGILGFSLWQLSIVLAILPMNFWYQSVIAFLFAAFGLRMIGDYLHSRLAPRNVLMAFSLFFVCVVFVLVSNPWGV